MAEYGLVLFKSTNHAVKAERAAEKAGLQVTLIPAPRDLGHDCGVALRFLTADQDRLAALLDSNSIEHQRIIASYS